MDIAKEETLKHKLSQRVKLAEEIKEREMAKKDVEVEVIKLLINDDDMMKRYIHVNYTRLMFEMGMRDMPQPINPPTRPAMKKC